MYHISILFLPHSLFHCLWGSSGLGAGSETGTQEGSLYSMAPSMGCVELSPCDSSSGEGESCNFFFRVLIATTGKHIPVS